MSRNASRRVWTPASAVCASISRIRYGLELMPEATLVWVKASTVQLKLLMQTRNRLECFLARAIAFRIWLEKCHAKGPSSIGARQSAGMTATPMLDSFLPTDWEASAAYAL